MTTGAIVGIETLHDGWLKVLRAEIRMPGGATVRREIEDHGSAACVLAYDPEHRTALLVRQFRAPVAHAAGDDSLLEVIAGMLEDEDPADCVRREAMEEAGLALGEVERVTAAWSCPGVSTEHVHLYLAVYRSAARDGAANAYRGHDGEATTVVEIGLSDLARLADGGGLADLKTLFLVQTLRLRRPELFSG